MVFTSEDADVVDEKNTVMMISKTPKASEKVFKYFIGTPSLRDRGLDL